MKIEPRTVASGGIQRLRGLALVPESDDERRLIESCFGEHLMGAGPVARRAVEYASGQEDGLGPHLFIHSNPESAHGLRSGDVG